MTASTDADRARQTRRDGPDVAEDPRFQRRSWTVERIGWAVTLLLLAAGVLGLFGSDGPLNRATAGGGDGLLHVEYARLTRHGASTALQVTVDGPATYEEEVRVVVGRDYLASVELVGILPEPQQVDLAPEAYIFVFPVAEGGAPLTITFEVEPRHYWRQRGTIGLADGEPLQITQFVYP